MAVDIYADLSVLHASLDGEKAKTAALELRVANLEQRVLRLENPPVPKLRLAVPSYFRPSSGQWEPLLAVRPLLTLINPGSGPGPSADAAYVAQVPKNRAAGVLTLGYVHTQYALRPIADVKADCLKHKQFYGVDGIFVDTTSVKPEHVAYYAELCAYIHSLPLKVCLNPGTGTLVDHVVMADWVMCAENYADKYLAATRPLWEKNYPGKLWHCVHACPQSLLEAVKAKALADGAGLLYATDDIMPNPYDKLPTYGVAYLGA